MSTKDITNRLMSDDFGIQELKPVCSVYVSGHWSQFDSQFCELVQKGAAKSFCYRRIVTLVATHSPELPCTAPGEARQLLLLGSRMLVDTPMVKLSFSLDTQVPLPWLYSEYPKLYCGSHSRFRKDSMTWLNSPVLLFETPKNMRLVRKCFLWFSLLLSAASWRDVLEWPRNGELFLQ